MLKNEEYVLNLLKDYPQKKDEYLLFGETWINNTLVRRREDDTIFIAKSSEIC